MAGTCLCLFLLTLLRVTAVLGQRLDIDVEPGGTAILPLGDYNRNRPVGLALQIGRDPALPLLKWTPGNPLDTATIEEYAFNLFKDRLSLVQRPDGIAAQLTSVTSNDTGKDVFYQVNQERYQGPKMYINLIARPPNVTFLNVTDVGMDYVNITWPQVIPLDSAPVWYYIEYRRPGVNSETWHRTANISATDATDQLATRVEGLLPAVWYEFRVVASNRFGQSRSATKKALTKGSQKRYALSGGAIVGIVVGFVFFIAIAVAAVKLYQHYQKKKINVNQRPEGNAQFCTLNEGENIFKEEVLQDPARFKEEVAKWSKLVGAASPYFDEQLSVQAKLRLKERSNNLVNKVRDEVFSRENLQKRKAWIDKMVKVFKKFDATLRKIEDGSVLCSLEFTDTASLTRFLRSYRDGQLSDTLTQEFVADELKLGPDVYMDVTLQVAKDTAISVDEDPKEPEETDPLLDGTDGVPSGGQPPATPAEQPLAAPAGGQPPAAPAGGQSPAAPAGGQPPAAPAGEQPPAAPAGEQPPAAPAGGQPPAAPAGEQPPAAPAGKQPPAAPAGKQPPAAPAGEQPPPAGEQPPAATGQTDRSILEPLLRYTGTGRGSEVEEGPVLTDRVNGSPDEKQPLLDDDETDAVPSSILDAAFEYRVALHYDKNSENMDGIKSIRATLEIWGFLVYDLHRDGEDSITDSYAFSVKKCQHGIFFLPIKTPVAKFRFKGFLQNKLREDEIPQRNLIPISFHDGDLENTDESVQVCLGDAEPLPYKKSETFDWRQLYRKLAIPGCPLTVEGVKRLVGADAMSVEELAEKLNIPQEVVSGNHGVTEEFRHDMRQKEELIRLWMGREGPEAMRAALLKDGEMSRKPENRREKRIEPSPDCMHFESEPVQPSSTVEYLQLDNTKDPPTSDDTQEQDTNKLDADGQPPNADGQPPNADGQPTNADGQPTNADGQPTNADGQPTNADGQPTNADGQPTNADGQPTNADGQPTDAHGQPPGAPGQPPDAHGQPPGAHGQPPGAHGQPPDEEPRNQQLLQQVQDILSGATTPLQEQTAKELLDLLKDVKDSWQDVQQCCSAIEEKLQLPSIEMLTADRAITMQLQESYEGMPDKRIAIRTTGDGDCLFHAVGKLLRGGREEHTMLLRLGAVVYAVNHQKCIVDELYGELKRADEDSVERFFAMISDVGQDKTDLYERLTDVVQEQARKTMNRGEYSGILPIKFLAGFVRSHILLYCPNPTDSIGYAEYNNVLRTPCSCILDSIPDTLQLEVMLVGAPRRNHFVGLVPTSDDRDVTETDGATNDRAPNGSDYSDEATGSGPTAKKEDAKATSQPPSQHGEMQQSAGAVEPSTQDEDELTPLLHVDESKAVPDVSDEKEISVNVDSPGQKDNESTPLLSHDQPPQPGTVEYLRDNTEDPPTSDDTKEQVPDDDEVPDDNKVTDDEQEMSMSIHVPVPEDNMSTPLLPQLQPEPRMTAKPRPQMRVSQIPFSIRHKLTTQLSVKRDDGRDWRLLADTLGYNDYIAFWDQGKDLPAERLLLSWQTKSEATVEMLQKTLEDLDMGAIAQILDTV